MSEIPEPLITALAERYHIQRVLGHGGMATVYEAQDMKHKRLVAVKVMRGDLARTIGPDRFLKEIEIVARLNHPHILTLIDSGEAAGFLYYVMPLVQGPSLRRRLDRSGPLGPDEVKAITREVAGALTYAHREGVVHRDIKPENILFSAGHAVVGDFGIAKAVSSAGVKQLTRTGFPLGTPGYMSPEQAIGRGSLGPATDIYSLACVAYEMLVGEPPDMWPSDEAVRLERFIDARPEHRDRLDRLPSQFERALVKALALRPEHRFETPMAFAEALDQSLGVRRYSPTEVNRIVGGAAEIQATRPTASGALTIGSVQQIAADVGIPPDQVQAAARKLDRPKSTLFPTSKFLGAPTAYEIERTLNGEVPESEFLALVEEIRATIGTVGTVSTLGQSLAWTSGPSANVNRDVHVTITPRGGRTRVRITERMRQLAGGLFGGIMGGMGGGGMGLVIGLGMGVLNSPVATAVFIPLWIGASYALARSIFKHISRKRGAELERLANRLEEHLVEVHRPALGRPT